ncbi:MAG: ATP-binding cassette domain-containing protein, partial [Erysipelotrichaceae bacterium]|nr:ATP-binding cassette domain-containing protein [Erysipelotrichaceae bacterium]
MIEFKKVSFAYEDKPVIENFDLLIPDGKVTAVMGLSGLGKTTVMKLAIGLLTPQGGE